MTTVQKMKDAKKTALQNELEYYSGLLAAHYSAAKIPSEHSKVPSNLRNSTVSSCSTLKTTNDGHIYKCTSFQPRTLTHLPNQNSKVIPNSNLLKQIVLPNKVQVSNSFNSRKYPCKSSMVKVNPSSFTYKSLNHTEKTSEYKNLLEKNVVDAKKQMNHGVMNKLSVPKSQDLMDELSVLINQLKQRSKQIDKKMNSASSINKSVPDKSELKTATKVPADSKIVCNTLNVSSNMDLKNKKGINFSSCDLPILPLSRNSTSYVFNGKKEIQHMKSPVNLNDSLLKPLKDSKHSFLQHSNRQIVNVSGNPCKKISQNLSAKFGNPHVLQVKTPVRKKLIMKHNSSGKKLSGTPLFASKYKVVNRKLPCVQLGKKVNVASPGFKTPVKIKPSKKHINSVKKIKGRARLIATKYKIINKKMPCVQFNSETTEDNGSKLLISNKWTNGVKIKGNKLNSKYKIVNRNEKSITVPTSLFAKKSIIPKESKVSNFVHQGSKNLHKFNVSNSARKIIYTTSKLHDERKMIKSMALLKENNLHVLNLKRKKHNLSRNSLILNSKYRTVNKQPGSSLKNNSVTAKSNNLSNDQKSNIDLDLLMEIAAEKKECNYSPITNLSSKHILIKRVYKSKNAIVNKNISSLQTKAAKMIKTKYSTLNKRHSWQKQGFTKRLVSPKYFKGQKFNGNYQRKHSFYYSPKNKRNISRHHVSAYFAGKNYPKAYLGSKNKSILFGPLRSLVKTPKRFVLNRKVYLKTANTLKLNSPGYKTVASRALNRSINRVLNATAKKKTSKVNVYCMFYNRFGRCNKGIKCPYVHDPSKIAVCTRFLRGTCKTENCPFSHEICPGKMAICSFFLLGSCTKTDCPYRHETLSPNAKLCKAFVEGYCPDGKQCKQAHVLVCPQFVQGHCEKGKACPFPHPPPKGKKAIPNSSEEKSENQKETEELTLEKVSRYFECGNEAGTNGTSSSNSIAVPRIRNLPEQPSFIAL